MLPQISIKFHLILLKLNRRLKQPRKKEKCFIESIKEDAEMKVIVPLREKDSLYERDEGKNFQFANGRSC